MERVLRVVDWLALTRRGQQTAGALQIIAPACAFGLIRLARHLNRPTAQ